MEESKSSDFCQFLRGLGVSEENIERMIADKVYNHFSLNVFHSFQDLYFLAVLMGHIVTGWQLRAVLSRGSRRVASRRVGRRWNRTHASPDKHSQRVRRRASTHVEIKIEAIRERRRAYRRALTRVAADVATQ